MTDPAAPDLAIVERLKRRGKPISEGHPDHDGGRYTYAPLVNPDGPEAAQCIEMLVAALDGIHWKSADRDNMEFAATITYSQMDRIRDALAKVRDR